MHAVDRVHVQLFKEVWLPVCPLFRSKVVLTRSIGSERLSVIENWEVVRSSEVRNVLKLC